MPPDRADADDPGELSLIERVRGGEAWFVKLRHRRSVLARDDKH